MGWAVGLPWFVAIVVAVVALLLGAVLTAMVVGGGTRRAAGKHVGTPAPDERAAATLRLEGEYWTIVFRGSTFRLHDAKGLRYIHRLLQAPDVEVHALELMLLGQPGPASAPRVDPDEVRASGPGRQMLVDPETLRRYRLRIEDLRDQIEEAEANVDPERGSRAQLELDRLTEELEQVVRPDGSPRMHRDEAERARLNVTRAIKSSIAKIQERDPSLGHHLDRDIRTGTYCSYRPDPATAPSWSL